MSPIDNLNGTVDGVVCLARDITERQQTETALRASEVKYRHLFESAGDSIFIIDASTHQFLNANWNGARRLGYTRKELLQLTIDDVCLPLEPDRSQAIRQELRATGSVIFEQTYRRKDGLELLVEISSRMIEYDNRLAFQMFVRDLTERKRAEEHLRLLESAVFNAKDAILITEAEPVEEPGPKIVYANQGFLETTGYTLEEVIGKTPRLLQGPKTDRAQLDKIRAALSQWQPVQVELINYRKDGSEFWVEINLMPFANEQGWYTHWLAVQRDITKRKQLEQAVEQLNQELELKIQHRTAELQQANAQLQAESRWRAQVEAALCQNVGVLIQGPNAEILLSNPAAFELLGLTESQLLGKTSFDPDWNVIAEDGSPFPAQSHPVPQAIATREAVRDVVMGVFCPTRGDRVWLLVNAEPQLALDGSVGQVLCTFSDITQLKEQR